MSTSHCPHSFHYLKDYLLPNFLLSKSAQGPSTTMTQVVDKISQFALENPVKFVAVSIFLILGGLPIVGFLAYAIASVIASLIGAAILSLVLLGIGLAGLAFVLCFVTCITLCTTSIFVSLYYSFRFVRQTVSSRRSVGNSEPTGDPIDKTK